MARARSALVLVLALLLSSCTGAGGLGPSASVPLVQLEVVDLHDGALRYNLSADAQNRTGLLNLTNALLQPAGLTIDNASANATIVGPGAAAAPAFQEGTGTELDVQLPTNGSAALLLRTSTDNATWGPWIGAVNISDWRAPSTFVQWMVQLQGGDANASPLLRGLALHFAVDHPPVADAGPDQQGYRGSTLTLDGTNSSDADEDPLTYIWQQLEGPTAVLSDFLAPAPTFTPNQLGVYRFRMVVNDGAGHSDLDETFVVIDNHPPQPQAGANQSARKGALVALNGSATDLDDPAALLTFQWNQVAGPTAMLSNATEATAQAVVPEVGTYVFSLRVNDTHGWSPPVTTTVSVGTLLPVAVLEVDPPSPLVNTSVLIDGSHSVDPDGTVRRFWFDFGDGTALDDTPNPTTVHTWTAAGTYPLQLVVTDDDGANSTATTLAVVVRPTPPPPLPNLPPGGTLSAKRLETPGAVTYAFHANVTDPDGAVVLFHWDLGDGTLLQGPGRPDVTHVYATKGEVLVRLQVTDDDDATTNLSLPLRIDNLLPTIESRTPSTPTVRLRAGEDLRLSVSASDPDDAAGTLTYLWQVDGIGQPENGSTLLLPTLANGTLTVVVTVLDPQGANATARWEVVVEAAPAASHPPQGVGPTLILAVGGLLAVLAVVATGALRSSAAGKAPTARLGRSRRPRRRDDDE